MEFTTLIKDYALQGFDTFDALPQQGKELLAAAQIREANRARQYEFITEHSRSDDIPLLLADVMESCEEAERMELPSPIKLLLDAMIAGALELAQPSINEQLAEEQGILNSVWYKYICLAEQERC